MPNKYRYLFAALAFGACATNPSMSTDEGTTTALEPSSTVVDITSTSHPPPPIGISDPTTERANVARAANVAGGPTTNERGTAMTIYLTAPTVRRHDPDALAAPLGGTVTKLTDRASRIDYTDEDGAPRWIEVFQLRDGAGAHRPATRLGLR